MGRIARLVRERKALAAIERAASERGDRAAAQAADDEIELNFRNFASELPTTEWEVKKQIAAAVAAFEGVVFFESEIQAESQRAQRLLWSLKRGAVYRGYVDQLGAIARMMVRVAPTYAVTQLVANIHGFYASGDRSSH